MRTLLIDNYDSFTYNLFQLISEVQGREPTVLANDAVADIADLGLDAYDNVVISPGPGHPGRPRDFGISAQVIAQCRIPLLGVCLGHQGIVAAEGGLVDSAPQPRHGYLDALRHDGRELFAGLPQGFTVVRYHSLAVGEPLPPTLEATAWSADGVVMALRHRRKPQWGMQFHPESVAGEFGTELLRNFFDIAGSARTSTISATRHRKTCNTTSLRLNATIIDRAVDTEAAFDRLYAGSPQSFWLDSEHVEPGLDRFSFLGDDSGPLAEVVRYRVGSRVVEVRRGADQKIVPGNIFDYLSTELRRRTLAAGDLPFDFNCGYVGYFGYELKADTGSSNRHTAHTHDAVWIFADRMVAVDHRDSKTYMLALDDGSAISKDAAEQWLSDTQRELEQVASWKNPPPLQRTAHHDTVAALLDRSRVDYLADIAACKGQLRAGESYEICLTNRAYVDSDVDSLDLYRVLRRCNPAPYAAYLKLADVAIASTSPERFLKIDRNGTVESKPIKGTAPRSPDPAEDARLRDELTASPKTRAENLMIVDLLRNDLGRVCEVGSVTVPALMVTETYSTVHQLVSTVRGQLRTDVDAIDCVRACFPGGSMTGAPKLRTLEIIDSLETEARGIYSGAIGFFGLAGTADLNVVIRTAVQTGRRWHVGAGGAIVLDSDPAAEYEELVLKAAATLRAFDTPGP
ncbi:aminodeoxychorismate synthase component I [Skermania sp. ID1734]|uniref:aminodeoxychorismate synthase component I n=1 Tax=Skermania sp. ID1734 TaxID=2597516 RepID=UPI00117FABFB|nr:aminodeoxychorismate synthase component I [Skermania sp. ID1734]TSE00110.1 aminodeoxychorismate synthase component I [Skermania sp. ID1734]